MPAAVGKRQLLKEEDERNEQNKKKNERTNERMSCVHMRKHME